MEVTTERNYFLDITRGLAALWVVLYHFGQARTYPDWYEALVSYGWLGVPIFFVISGYSIGISIDRTKYFHSFLIKRFARIYPAYWISLLLIAILIVLQKFFTGNNSIVAFPKSIVGLLNSVFCFYKPLTNTDYTNWVYWTLIYELFFYFAFSLALFIESRFRNIFFMAIVSMSLMYPYFLNVNALFFLKLVGYFSLGISLNEIAKKKWIEAFILIVISILSILQNKVYCVSSDNKLASTYGLIAALIFSIFVLALSHLFKKKSVLSKVGDWSYGIYLFHIPIGVYLVNLIGVSPNYSNSGFFVIYDVILILLVILCSWFVYKFIEHPCMQFFKKY